MPSVICSNCGKKYRIDDSAAGKKFACKQCGNVIRVPAATTPAATALPVDRKRPAPPPPVPFQAAETTSGELDFNDMASLETTGEVDNSIPVMNEAPASTYVGTRATAAPAIAKKSLSPPRIGFRFNRGILILIAVGIGITIWGGREWMLGSSASATPQEITCSELGQNGPGSNAHVRVTSFFATSGYVAWKEQSGDFQTIWYPIIPPDSFRLPAGKRLKAGARIVPDTVIDSAKIHVLIKTHAAKTEGDVVPTMSRDSVDGLVINKIDSLTQREQDLLHEKYPSLSQDNCYIVEDGRKPQGGLGLLAAVGGVVLAVVGLFMMFKPTT